MSRAQIDPLKLYTFAKAAEILHVGRRTIASWVASGRLPATMLGPRSPRILESDLREFIERNRRSVR